MRSRFFSKAGLCRFLSSLEAPADDFVTVYIAPNSFPDYADMLSLGPKYGAYAGEIKEAIKTEAVIVGADKYRTGAVIFWDGVGNNHIVLPPFPIAEDKVSAGKFDTSVLYEVLERRYVIGVVLVAWGSYALGVFDAGNLVAWKKGTGYIHKKHKKGGRSQKRFARRTEEQKKDFLRRVGNRIEERFGSFAPDYIFFGGNRLILNPLIQESKYLQTKAGKISPRILHVRYADREALAGSLAEINKSLVFSF
ncbi:Vms1/Ankzf1 family peptidyl-tRNA hydrolase [Chloroflexota bacterium]